MKPDIHPLQKRLWGIRRETLVESERKIEKGRWNVAERRELIQINYLEDGNFRSCGDIYDLCNFQRMIKIPRLDSTKYKEAGANIQVVARIS